MNNLPHQGFSTPTRDNKPVSIASNGAIPPHAGPSLQGNPAINPTLLAQLPQLARFSQTPNLMSAGSSPLTGSPAPQTNLMAAMMAHMNKTANTTGQSPLAHQLQRSLQASTLSPLAAKPMHQTSTARVASPSIVSTNPTAMPHGSFPMTSPTASVRSSSGSHHAKKKVAKSKQQPVAYNSDDLHDFLGDAMESMKPSDLAIARYIRNQEFMADIFSLVPTNKLPTYPLAWSEKDLDALTERRDTAQKDTVATQEEYENLKAHYTEILENCHQLESEISDAESLDEINKLQESIHQIQNRVSKSFGALEQVENNNSSPAISYPTGSHYIML
ncbi:hypothetical protein IWQ62_001857 [Dispira parvispora]|uniref:Uncharacterized protein n=1 Tax=Dispira parvispora TaxID=1520584 RepID=A0A9W8E3C7_9FUNG|nr:hypothetical protein IWQ62_001857 [Dispira parvispora]